jgi:hypothetical protein
VASDTPLCGAADCPNRATRADPSGVGYCRDHGDDFDPVGEGNPFDEWWAAAALAEERGNPAWDGLDYGQWPVEAS